MLEKKTIKMTQQIEDHARYVREVENMRRSVINEINSLKMMMCISVDPSADEILDRIERQVTKEYKKAKQETQRKGTMFVTLSSFFLRALGLQIELKLDILTHAPYLAIDEKIIARIIGKMLDGAFKKLLEYPESERKIRLIFDEDGTLYKLAIESHCNLESIDIGLLKEKVIEFNGKIKQTNNSFELYFPKTNKKGKPILQLIQGGYND